MDGLTRFAVGANLDSFLTTQGTPGRGVTASVKVIDRPPLPPPIL